MNLLILTGPLYPGPGNNANLISKLIPFLQAAGHEVRVFSSAFGHDGAELPAEWHNVPVYWAADSRRDFKRKLVYPAISKLVDPNGFSDALQVQIFSRELREVRKQYPFDAVLSTSEPYTMAVTAAGLRGVKKVLYIMDPPACVSRGKETVYRNRTLRTVVKRQNAIITTPFIIRAMQEHGVISDDGKFVPVGFPMICPHEVETEPRTDGRIRLLFCGWLYSDIRSPRYFLDILSRLDERFSVTFMGRECEKLTERFEIQTKAELITLPQQPYEKALQAMADADILINIGNSVPVHMPSKTLEYINTGKPFVNFYKLDDCPTLYYTKRYPLCLNLYEGERDMDAAAERFIHFCVSNRGKTADRRFIETEYAECTPEYIAQKIVDIMES